MSRNHEPKLEITTATETLPPAPEKITRVSVDLTRTQVGVLEALMKRSGMSKAAVMRFGLGILADSCSDKDDGFIVGAWKENKERRYPVL